MGPLPIGAVGVFLEGHANRRGIQNNKINSLLQCKPKSLRLQCYSLLGPWGPNQSYPATKGFHGHRKRPPRNPRDTRGKAHIPKHITFLMAKPEPWKPFVQWGERGAPAVTDRAAKAVAKEGDC